MKSVRAQVAAIRIYSSPSWAAGHDGSPIAQPSACGPQARSLRHSYPATDIAWPPQGAPGSKLWLASPTTVMIRSGGPTSCSRNGGGNERRGPCTKQASPRSIACARRPSVALLFRSARYACRILDRDLGLCSDDAQLYGEDVASLIELASSAPVSSAAFSGSRARVRASRLYLDAPLSPNQEWIRMKAISFGLQLTAHTRPTV